MPKEVLAFSLSGNEFASLCLILQMSASASEASHTRLAEVWEADCNSGVKIDPAVKIHRERENQN